MSRLAVPGGLGRVAGQGAVGAMVSDEFAEVGQQAHFQFRNESIAAVMTSFSSKSIAMRSI